MSEKKGLHEEESLESIEHVLTDSERFVEKNQKNIVNAALSIIVVILAVMAFNRYVSDPKEKEAQSQLFAGELLFERDSFRLAVEGDGMFVGFEAIADEYSSTPSGNLAKYYAGISYLRLSDYDKAISYLNKFDAEGEMMPAIKEGAIGDCYMEKGELDKAISAFKKAASFENAFTAPIYLKKCGIAYEEKGDVEKAVACYQEVKDEYPSSIEGSDIEKYIARAQASIK